MNKRVEAKRIIKKVKIVKAPRKTDKPTGQIPLTNNLDNLHKLTEAHFARSGNASSDVKEEIEPSLAACFELPIEGKEEVIFKLPKDKKLLSPK